MNSTPDLVERPFSTTPSPRYFYLASQYRKAVNHAISTVVEREGLCIISGPVGSGKSTLLRFLIDWLAGELIDSLRLGIIYNPSFSTDFQLLKAICREFHIEARARKDEQLEALKLFAAEQSEAGNTVVVVIDEAHKLTGPQFELVREFFNFAQHDHFFIQVILAGEQKPLTQKLKNKGAIVSRAMYYDELQPLTRDEVAELIRYRLKVADLPESLFKDDAITRVHEVSGGIPRSVVKIGRHVFARLEVDGTIKVTAKLIDEVLTDGGEALSRYV
jgi:type II secretory pathway predicted ATPase ExeA